MPVRIGTGLSIDPVTAAGARAAAAAARVGLDGARCDLAVMFASGAHLVELEESHQAVLLETACEQLIGCGAGGVLATGHEVETGTAIAVWAAAFDGGEATTFVCEIESAGEGMGRLSGLPDTDGSSGIVLLADPYSFPTEPVLGALGEQAGGVPIVGGIASARRPTGEAALLRDAELVDEGAVGVSFTGVELLPCVSQGARPLGPELTITAAEGNVIGQLAGRPALDKLRETLGELSGEDRELIESAAGGLLLGIVIDPGKPEYVQGDFLVRGLVGADHESGAIAVGAHVKAGQVVRLHARDADCAHRDLAEALAVRMDALGGEQPAGALVFSCNGRGENMFGQPDHDVTLTGQELGGAPLAGFFCAGEIGPVGGQPFLHGFTATLAVFPR